MCNSSSPLPDRAGGKKNPSAAAEPLQEELGQLGPADNLSQKLFSMKIYYSLTLLGADL